MSCVLTSCSAGPPLATGIRGRKQLLWDRKRLWVGEVRDSGWTKVGSGKMVSFAQMSYGLGSGQIGTDGQGFPEDEQRVFPQLTYLLCTSVSSSVKLGYLPCRIAQDYR